MLHEAAHGALTVLSPLVSVVAQSGSGGVEPLNWGSLISGALGSSPVAVALAWRLAKADSENKRLHDELRATNDKTLELAERALPALVEATQALRDVRAATERDRPNPELAQVLGDLRRLTDDLGRDRRGQR